MMIIERVEVDIKDGHQEAFAKLISENEQVFRALEGCRQFNFGRGVENPGRFIMLVGWDSVESHRTAAQNPSPEMKLLGGKMASCFEGAPRMEHFALS